MKAKTETIHVRVTVKVREALEAEAAQRSKSAGMLVTVSDIVRRYVESGVSKNRLHKHQLERLSK